MYTQVTEYDFIKAFDDYGRMGNFQRDGLWALYLYLTDLEQDTGEKYELDVIALCCDFTRFDSLRDYNEQYGTDYDDMYDIEEIACAIDDDAFICYAH
jgi:hypothetical protein